MPYEVMSTLTDAGKYAAAGVAVLLYYDGLFAFTIGIPRYFKTRLRLDQISNKELDKKQLEYVCNDPDGYPLLLQDKPSASIATINRQMVFGRIVENFAKKRLNQKTFNGKPLYDSLYGKSWQELLKENEPAGKMVSLPE